MSKSAYICSMKNTLLLFLCLLLISCQTEEKSTDKKTMVVTTNIIYDAAQFIAGDVVEVKALMGPGVDPHLYKASQKDVSLLTLADLIIYNGLHLEGKMIEVLEKLKRSKKVFALSDALNEKSIIMNDDMGTADPHFWFDAIMLPEFIDNIIRNFNAPVTKFLLLLLLLCAATINRIDDQQEKN